MRVFWTLLVAGIVAGLAVIPTESNVLGVTAVVLFIGAAITLVRESSTASKAEFTAAAAAAAPNVVEAPRPFATPDAAEETVADAESTTDEAPETVDEPTAVKDDTTVEATEVAEQDEPVVEVAADVTPDPELVSALGAVNGLGAAKRERVAAVYPTIEAIRGATIEDLTAIDGIGPKLAETIVTWMATDPRDLLSEVPGVGPAKVDAIAAVFPTAAQLRVASVDELTSIKGVGPALATKIKAGVDA